MTQEIGKVKVKANALPSTNTATGSVKVGTTQLNAQRVQSIQYSAGAGASAANNAFEKANLAYDIAVAGYTQANVAFTTGNAAYATANASYATANASYAFTNTTYIHANSAYATANASYATANAAYVTGNASYSTANASYSIANASYSSWVSVISSGKPIAFNRLAAIRLAKDWPIKVRTGKPVHRASLAVVCALQGGVSRNKSA